MLSRIRLTIAHYIGLVAETGGESMDHFQVIDIDRHLEAVEGF